MMAGTRRFFNRTLTRIAGLILRRRRMKLIESSIAVCHQISLKLTSFQLNLRVMMTLPER